MPKILMLFASFLVTAHAAETPATQPQERPAAPEVERVEGGTIHFKTPPGSTAPKPLNTGLFDVKPLSMLSPPAGGGAPYVLFTARPCEKCDRDRGVYMVRMDGTKATQFVHPGRVLEPKSNAVLIDSRAFYGRCLPNEDKDVYVVFQKERIDRRRSLQPSVFVAEAGKDYIAERLIERRLPRIEKTLKLVKRKQCHEIAGVNRLMLAKPISLTPKRLLDDEEGDEQDDAPKENQTQEELPPAVE